VIVHGCDIERVGDELGDEVGWRLIEGDTVGDLDGFVLGFFEEGESEGALVWMVGVTDGLGDGRLVGRIVGNREGFFVFKTVGALVWFAVSELGINTSTPSEGDELGKLLGEGVEIEGREEGKTVG
jgi:hypothetical protein